MASSSRPIHWGILGTANIARSSFLPALRTAGGGIAYSIAGREAETVRAFARENHVDNAVEGYDHLLHDGQVEAVYIPLPNVLHAEWTIRALEAGKAVLCEKPLCVSPEETQRVLDVARVSSQPLWEAFVFPFHRQMNRLMEIIQRGTIGDVREIHSVFHFRIRSRQNIRLSAELAGGALNDVGCYPVRLARLIFAADPISGMAAARWAVEGVDEEMQGILTFPDDRRLLLSCGMSRRRDTLARIIGTEGECRLSNPFHPTVNDTLEIFTESADETERMTGPEPSFTNAIRHIHAVLRGEEQPRHLAVDDTLGNARALDLLHRSARSGKREHP